MLFSRDNSLWLQLWRERRIDFHQQAVNQFLVKSWPGLRHQMGSRVFVPLCGKSLDMIWLAQQGHEVIGVELSPIAVKAFFKENRLQAVKQRMGEFTLWQHGRISILCGDFFSLNKADLGRIDTVYDRAALTALPEDIRKLYVSHMCSLLPANADVFLLTVEDAQEGETWEQARGIGAEIGTLYTNDYDISLVEVESVYEADPEATDQSLRRAEYKVYKLTGKREMS